MGLLAMLQPHPTSTWIDFINEQTILFFLLTALLLACFRGCLLRIPYATILSTLISTCGLMIGLAALFDITTIVERFAHDLLLNYLVLTDFKLVYIFAALFIVVVIVFNLIMGFIATDQSLYRVVEDPSQAQRRGCCAVSCLRGSTALCLLQTFLVFNYVIYYLLLLVTIVSFIALYTSYVVTVLCNEAPAINQPLHLHARLPTEAAHNKVLDLRQFAPVVGLASNETQLLYFEGLRLQKFCMDYVAKLNLPVILCTIGFLLACAGFVNYLINFSVNSAKLSTKQKFTELIYLNSEEMPFDANKY